MAAPPKPEQDAKPPAKSKKMLVIIAAALVLVLLAGGGWFYLSRQQAALDDEDETPVQATVPKGPPTYLPLDNMVVNLADPGGERVAQIGITLELTDAKAPERVKPYLPAIRNSVLLLVSQRKAEELLQREGKEQLAADILTEASRHFEPEGGKKKKKAKGEGEGNPVRAVLFSNLIVQ